MNNQYHCSSKIGMQSEMSECINTASVVSLHQTEFTVCRSCAVVCCVSVAMCYNCYLGPSLYSCRQNLVIVIGYLSYMCVHKCTNACFEHASLCVFKIIINI